MVMAVVFIEPGERLDAVEAYRDRLTPEQIDLILEADDSAIIRLGLGVGGSGTQVMVIEEG